MGGQVQLMFADKQRIQSAGFSAMAAPAASDAGMLIQSEISGEHWVAAGDAMASLDPLSSHGMTQALQTIPYGKDLRRLISGRLIDGVRPLCTRTQALFKH